MVVDDAAQGVTHVVRGADLLDNTPRQIICSGCSVCARRHAHLPVLVEADGSKLSKSARSVPLDGRAALPQFLTVFGLLGLAPPASLATGTIGAAWTWAIEHWDVKRVGRRLTRPLGDCPEPRTKPACLNAALRYPLISVSNHWSIGSQAPNRHTPVARRPTRARSPMSDPRVIKNTQSSPLRYRRKPVHHPGGRETRLVVEKIDFVVVDKNNNGHHAQHSAAGDREQEQLARTDPDRRTSWST